MLLECIGIILKIIKKSSSYWISSLQRQGYNTPTKKNIYHPYLAKELSQRIIAKLKYIIMLLYRSLQDFEVEQLYNNIILRVLKV